MTRRKTLVQLGEQDSEQAETTSAMNEAFAPEAADDDMQPLFEEQWPDEPAPSSTARDKILTGLLVVAIAAWSGAYFWFHKDAMLAGASGPQWLASVGEWALPALMLVVIWQLAIRNGTGEQARFANAAALLSHESAELENRLVAVNRELSLAREFIASQSRDLESLGRLAAERLSGSADHIQSLIAHNSEQIERIGQVGDTAIGNMERLRDQLPVLANSARDMTNQIANAGNIAQQQVKELIGGVEQLEQLGSAGQSHVEDISARLTQTLDLFDHRAGELGGMAEHQFHLLQRQSEEFRNLLRTQDQEAVDALQERAGNLTAFLEQRNDELIKIEEMANTGMRERVETMIAENDRLLRAMIDRRNEASQGARQMIEGLEQRLTEAVQTIAKIDETALGNARARLAALADESARIEATIGQHASHFEAEVLRRREDLDQREIAALAALEQRLNSFDSKVTSREESHLAHVAALAERGEQLAAKLAQFDADLGQLGSQAATAREDVGLAADVLVERLTRSREILSSNSDAIAELNSAGFCLLELLRTNSTLLEGDVAASIGNIEARIGTFGSNAETLRDVLSQAETSGAALAVHVENAREHGASTMGLLQQLEQQLGELAERSAMATGQTRDELQSAIDMLSGATNSVLDELRSGNSEAIREIAEQIAAKSHSAIASALSDHVGATIAEIDASAKLASEAGRATVSQLRDQLAVVNQLAGNLEQRVAVARERAEEQVGDDFARRMALITEALNSGAIDIAKAFDNEVSDTQWANYLRGDRGIFTRRAVRLLDKSEARAVLDFYEADGEFRETVNRYIHDFEAMLRSVLSTRDGNVMAVTLLSSDVGKLYVCLAQSIDRLRA